MDDNSNIEDMAFINMENIGTMSLEEFKNLINSTLTVPNGTANSLGSTDSLQSENSSDDVKPYMNGVSENRLGYTHDTLVKRAHLMKTTAARTSTNTKPTVASKTNTGLKTYMAQISSAKPIQRTTTPSSLQKTNSQTISSSTDRRSATPTALCKPKPHADPCKSDRPKTPSCLPRPTTPTISRRSLLQSNGPERPTTPSFSRIPQGNSSSSRLNRAATPNTTPKGKSQNDPSGAATTDSPIKSSTSNGDKDMSTNAHANIFKNGTYQCDRDVKATDLRITNRESEFVRSSSSFTNSDLDLSSNSHANIFKTGPFQDCSAPKPATVKVQSHTNGSDRRTISSFAESPTSHTNLDLSTNAHANIFKCAPNGNDSLSSPKVLPSQTSRNGSARPITPPLRTLPTADDNCNQSRKFRTNTSVSCQNDSFIKSAPKTSVSEIESTNNSFSDAFDLSANSHANIFRSRPYQNDTVIMSEGSTHDSRARKDAQQNNNYTNAHSDRISSVEDKNFESVKRNTSNCDKSPINNDSCFVVSAFVKGVEMKQTTENEGKQQYLDCSWDDEDDEDDDEMKMYSQTPVPSTSERRPSTPSLIPRPSTPKRRTDSLLTPQAGDVNKPSTRKSDLNDTKQQIQNVNHSHVSSINSMSNNKDSNRSTTSIQAANTHSRESLLSKPASGNNSNCVKNSNLHQNFTKSKLQKTGSNHSNDLRTSVCSSPITTRSCQNSRKTSSRPASVCVQKERNEDTNYVSVAKCKTDAAVANKNGNKIQDHKSTNMNSLNRDSPTQNTVNTSSSEAKHTINRKILLRKNNLCNTPQSIRQENVRASVQEDNKPSWNNQEPTATEHVRSIETPVSKLKNAHNRPRRMSDGNIRPMSNYSKKEVATGPAVDNNTTGIVKDSGTRSSTAWTENKMQTRDKKQLNITPSKRRASVPSSVQIDDSELKPRPLTGLQSVLSLHMDGTDKIDTDNLEPPPADAEMFAKMELLFNKYKEMELNSSQSEGNNVKTSTSSSNKENIRAPNRRQRAPSPSPVCKQNKIRDSGTMSSNNGSEQWDAKEKFQKSSLESSSKQGILSGGKTVTRNGTAVEEKSPITRANNAKNVHSPLSTQSTKIESKRLQRSPDPTSLSHQSLNPDFSFNNGNKQQSYTPEALSKCSSRKEEKTNLKSRIPVPGMKRSKSLSSLLNDNQEVFSLHEIPLHFSVNSTSKDTETPKPRDSTSFANPKSTSDYSEMTCKDTTNNSHVVEDRCRPKTPVPKLATPLTTGRSTFRKSRSEEKENLLVRSVSMDLSKPLETYTFDDCDLEYL